MVALVTDVVTIGTHQVTVDVAMEDMVTIGSRQVTEDAATMGSRLGFQEIHRQAGSMKRNIFVATQMYAKPFAKAYSSQAGSTTNFTATMKTVLSNAADS